jgi:hypothetical protein
VAASLVQSAAAWLVDFGLAPDPSVAAEIPYDPAEGYFHFFGGKAMPAGIPADYRWCQVQWPSKTQAFNYRLSGLTSLSERKSYIVFVVLQETPLEQPRAYFPPREGCLKEPFKVPNL